MRGLVGQHVRRFDQAAWPVVAAQTLEEHHLAAWARDQRTRDRFALDLAESLAQMDDTHVCILDGSRIVDLCSFCAELALHASEEPIERSIESERGVVGVLRRRPTMDGVRPAKRRYIFWREAHVLLARDPALFGRLVDAIAGVAAEGEFVSDDVLFLQRAVFIGSGALDMYAEDPAGQFRSWFTERGETPLWRVITGVEGPSVARWKIDE